jgi:hypothetical protein
VSTPSSLSRRGRSPPCSLQHARAYHATDCGGAHPDLARRSHAGHDGRVPSRARGGGGGGGGREARPGHAERPRYARGAARHCAPRGGALGRVARVPRDASRGDLGARRDRPVRAFQRCVYGGLRALCEPARHRPHGQARQCWHLHACTGAGGGWRGRTNARVWARRYDGSGYYLLYSTTCCTLAYIAMHDVRPSQGKEIEAVLPALHLSRPSYVTHIACRGCYVTSIAQVATGAAT